MKRRRVVYARRPPYDPHHRLRSPWLNDPEPTRVTLWQGELPEDVSDDSEPVTARVVGLTSKDSAGPELRVEIQRPDGMNAPSWYVARRPLRALIVAHAMHVLAERLDKRSDADRAPWWASYASTPERLYIGTYGPSGASARVVACGDTVHAEVLGPDGFEFADGQAQRVLLTLALENLCENTEGANLFAAIPCPPEGPGPFVRVECTPHGRIRVQQQGEDGTWEPYRGSKAASYLREAIRSVRAQRSGVLSATQ